MYYLLPFLALQPLLSGLGGLQRLCTDVQCDKKRLLLLIASILSSAIAVRQYSCLRHSQVPFNQLRDENSISTCLYMKRRRSIVGFSFVKSSLASGAVSHIGQLGARVTRERKINNIAAYCPACLASAVLLPPIVQSICIDGQSQIEMKSTIRRLADRDGTMRVGEGLTYHQLSYFSPLSLFFLLAHFSPALLYICRLQISASFDCHQKHSRIKLSTLALVPFGVSGEIM